MPTAILRHAFNFHEVAENVMSLVKTVVGTDSFYISHTDPETFTLLHVTSRRENNPIQPGMSVPLEHAL